MSYQRRKSPILSGILSFFIPGAGQFYNEDFLKGIIIFAATIASIISIVYSAIAMGSRVMNGQVFPDATLIVRIVTAALILFGLWLYGLIDSIIYAQKTNVGPAVNPGPNGATINAAYGDINQKSAAKSKEGLIGLGVVLVVFGLIGILLQVGLRFDDLIKYGAPIAIILVGGYLVLRTTGIFKGGQ